MCDERMTTVHGHLVNEVFQEEEWRDLILLNGLNRLPWCSVNIPNIMTIVAFLQILSALAMSDSLTHGC